MALIKRAGRSMYQVRVPTQHGWVQRGTGTSDKPTALLMERMIADLGPTGKRAWDLLDAVAENRLTIPDLFDAHRMNDLDGLRARMTDLDLRPMVDEWERWAVGQVGAVDRKSYRRNILSMAPEAGPWWLSTFTRPACSTWLATRQVGPSTKRRCAAAMSSFARFLIERSVLEVSPMAGVKLPKASPARTIFLELHDVERVVAASEGVARYLLAFIYGTGAELSAALGVRRGDVNLATNLVMLRGTKNDWRNREVYVSAWAQPFVAEACRELVDDGQLLFPGLDRWTASDTHRRTLEALGLRVKGEKGGYTMHDARHHWAVRAIRAGTPIELVARQLGHADGVLCLKVYGRYKPKAGEMAHWEERAREADARRQSVPESVRPKQGRVVGFVGPG